MDESEFQKVILTRTLEQSESLTDLIATNNKQTNKLDSLDHKVDVLDTRVEHTNGTVRELQIDMAVTKARHAAEDTLRRELTEAVNRIFHFLKKWLTNVFWVIFTGVSILLLTYMWNHLLPGHPFPKLPGVND